MTSHLRNDRFASHTRSASFTVTLSQPMIEFLLENELLNKLCAKYPWHRPYEVNFGDPAEAVAEWARSGTISALARRGLVDITIPDDVGFCRHEAIQLTEAGRLMCGLLREAGFTAELHGQTRVPIHPDDRPRLHVDDRGRWQTDPSPGDRRDPADIDHLSRPVWTNA